jgi:uncharacterized coiled-coil DUF342 family protein
MSTSMSMSVSESMLSDAFEQFKLRAAKDAAAAEEELDRVKSEANDVLVAYTKAVERIAELTKRAAAKDLLDSAAAAALRRKSVGPTQCGNAMLFYRRACDRLRTDRDALKVRCDEMARERRVARIPGDYSPPPSQPIHTPTKIN